MPSAAEHWYWPEILDLKTGSTLRLASGSFVELVGVTTTEAAAAASSGESDAGEAAAATETATEPASTASTEPSDASDTRGSTSRATHSLTVMHKSGESKGTTRTITDLADLQWLPTHSNRRVIGAKVLCKEGSGTVCAVKLTDTSWHYDVEIKAGKQTGEIVTKLRTVRADFVSEDGQRPSMSLRHAVRLGGRFCCVQSRSLGLLTETLRRRVCVAQEVFDRGHLLPSEKVDAAAASLAEGRKLVGQQGKVKPAERVRAGQAESRTPKEPNTERAEHRKSRTPKEPVPPVECDTPVWSVTVWMVSCAPSLADRLPVC
jgi:hypothetical protein